MSNKSKSETPVLLTPDDVRGKASRMTSTDSLVSLAKEAGGAYVAGTDSWQVAVSVLTHKSRETGVYGDKRSKDAIAVWSVDEYAGLFSVTPGRVGQWHRAGRALSVGCPEGDVKVFLRSPGKYHAATVDAALEKGDKAALTLGMAERDRLREAAAAERAQSKDDDSATPEEPQTDGALTVIAEAPAPGDTLADVIDRLLPRIIGEGSTLGHLIAVRDTLEAARATVDAVVAERIAAGETEEEPAEEPASA